jgi:DNA (cytosine-5)-methyltransferase 1
MRQPQVTPSFFRFDFLELAFCASKQLRMQDLQVDVQRRFPQIVRRLRITWPNLNGLAAWRAMKKIRAIDLFCGAGGSSWGAQSAGVEIVAGFDLWPLAGKAHKTNFPKSEFIEGRLEDHKVNQLAKRLGKIDLILASPECTNHSPAKGNKPRCEQSKDTAFQVIRYAKAFKPRWIVIENVVSMKSWSRYAEFREGLEALGYLITEQKLNAAHFGVGQSRRRLFVLCDREQEPKKTPKLAKVAPNVSSIVNLDGKYPWTPLRTERRAAATLERAERGIKALGENKSFLLVYYGSDGAGGWQKLNRPLRTITTVDRFAIVKPTPTGHEMRMLQVPELQEAMGMGKMRFECGSRRDRIKMLGNAVCPPVMKWVLKTLTASA